MSDTIASDDKERRQLLTMGRLILAVPALIGIGILLAVAYWGDEEFVKFYADKLRASLFTGFFTLSGFLLSAKTFIILNLKKEMFSTDTYLKHVKKQRALAKNGALKVYQPLRDIGFVLLMNVALCLASSLCQFSVGLIDSIWAVAACLSLAGAAGGMLIFSLIIISKNLHDMYDHFEEEASEKIKCLK